MTLLGETTVFHNNEKKLLVETESKYLQRMQFSANKKPDSFNGKLQKTCCFQET